MNEDVSDERAHEHERSRFRVGDLDYAGLSCASEVVGNDSDASARRTVLRARFEWEQDCSSGAFVELDDHVLRDRLLSEGDPPLGQVSQDDARIGRSVDRLQVEDALGQRNRRPHGLIEERLFRLEMPEHCGRRDTQLARDVRQGTGVEPLLREELPSRFEEQFAVDDRWPSHL